jgi:DNA-binding GntR family transcriptional regulator
VTAGPAPPDNPLIPDVLIAKENFARPRQSWVSMVDIAYDGLLEAISEGRLGGGSRLDIKTAASQLGMSATPVREALARLHTQGLINLDANRGYRVSAVLNEVEFHQLYAARRVIEIGALRGTRVGDGSRSQVKAPPDELRHLAELEHVARSSPHGPRYADYFDFTRADAQFHATVMSLAKNPFLEASWKALNFHLHVSRLYAGAGVIDYAEAQLEHGAILEAVVAGNYKELILACQNHIDNSEARLARLVP